MPFDYFGYIVIPVLIFLARIADVSIGTVKLVFISKGMRNVAPLLGFFEVLIWIIVVSKLINNIEHFYYYFAYAGGFATGTFVGMKIEEKLSVGKVLLRIITQKDTASFINKLKGKKYSLTIFDGEGSRGKVKLIFLVIDRKDLPEIIKDIKEFNPNAFYSVEDVRFAKDNDFKKEKKSSWLNKTKNPQYH